MLSDCDFFSSYFLPLVVGFIVDLNTCEPYSFLSRGECKPARLQTMQGCATRGPFPSSVGIAVSFL
jgi:hypothetical protein